MDERILTNVKSTVDGNSVIPPYMQYSKTIAAEGWML